MTASNGRPAAAVARELCRSGAILVTEGGGRLAVALDPGAQDDLDLVRALVTAALGDGAGTRRAGGTVVLQLSTAEGWQDAAAVDSLDGLLAHIGAWVHLARPPAWSTVRVPVAGAAAAAPADTGPADTAPADTGPADMAPEDGGALPDWIAALAGRAVADAAELLEIAGRHGPAVEALLAEVAAPAPGAPDAPDATGSGARGGAPRYLDHRSSDGRPPDLTHPLIRDWILEVHATRHAIVATPVTPVAQGSRRIVVFPTLRAKFPTLNMDVALSGEPAVGAFVLICSAGL